MLAPRSDSNFHGHTICHRPSTRSLGSSNRAQLNASTVSSTVLLRTKLACAALASSLLLASPCGATDKPLSGAQSVPPGLTSQTTSSATESSPIRVIVALPITGARRSVGAAARQRLSLVKSAIDAAGGIRNRQLQLVFQTTPALATQRAISQRASPPCRLNPRSSLVTRAPPQPLQPRQSTSKPACCFSPPECAILN